MLCAFVDSTVFALVIAAMQSNRISIFLPNYSKAILSARRIFKLLDTQPVIDSYSSEGLKLVSKIQLYTIWMQSLLYKAMLILIKQQHILCIPTNMQPLLRSIIMHTHSYSNFHCEKCLIRYVASLYTICHYKIAIIPYINSQLCCSYDCGFNICY